MRPLKRSEAAEDGAALELGAGGAAELEGAIEDETASELKTGAGAEEDGRFADVGVGGAEELASAEGVGAAELDA